MIPFPEIDPVAVQIGPLAVRWYGLAYVAGFVLGQWLAMRLADRDPMRPSRKDIDRLAGWLIIGVALGGRLGFVLFYNLAYYLEHPLEVLAIWQGGMSFHGGLLGVVTALLLFSWRSRIPLLALSDIVAVVVPIGLFFGRLANFINAELWGRPTDAPWGVVFPGQDIARHPSQLYEAALEGVVLFAVLFLLARIPSMRRRTGALTGVFLLGYGLARITVEFFREPDAHLGYLFAGATMGQLLSFPMVLVGLLLIWRAPWPQTTQDAEATRGRTA